MYNWDNGVVSFDPHVLGVSFDKEYWLNNGLYTFEFVVKDTSGLTASETESFVIS